MRNPIGTGGSVTPANIRLSAGRQYVANCAPGCRIDSVGCAEEVGTVAGQTVTCGASGSGEVGIQGFDLSGSRADAVITVEVVDEDGMEEVAIGIFKLSRLG